MEGSESEVVFESLNLNPQLFINETLNTVDDLLDDAFHFFHQSVPFPFLFLFSNHVTNYSCFFATPQGSINPFENWRH